MTFTSEQEKAINASGNTLVLAGAGSGKTRTLVERCARLIIGGASVRDLLVVTFNEAAAAEVRSRLRKRLEDEAKRSPANQRLGQELALLDGAQISTLHSFCLRLIREHFYELDLDPGVTVLDDTEAQILFLRTIEELLLEHYEGQHENSGAVQEYIRSHLHGRDKLLVTFIRKVHEFTQTRPDPQRWFEKQFALLQQEDAAQWQQWFRHGVQEWGREWLLWLQRLPVENTNAHACAELLTAADPDVIDKILERDKNGWPRKKKGEHREPFKKMFVEAEFLKAFAQQSPGEKPPLEEDWEWSRKTLQLLLQVVEQFTARYSSAKHDRSALDFHDLEQYALRLLWKNDLRTAVASQWRDRFRAIFVDEYQDINAAQDLIIRAISKDAPGNRFLVGDNKQSIYRFRQADPSIFGRYLETAEGWEKAYLRENFRSHEGILRFVNPLFTWVMSQKVGGVAYDDRARLLFPDGEEQQALRWNLATRQTELHIIVSDVEEPVPEGNEEQADVAEEADQDLASAEIEARFVAARLREMHASGFSIPDRAGGRRRVAWRDMVILLRSAASKLDTYAKAFEAAGVPLHTKRKAFFNAQEVMDLCNTLHVLDNPLQDIPLVAALRSPLCGLTNNELGAIRAHSPKARPFWRALNQYHESKPESPARDKIETFLNRCHRWRRASGAICHRLELILSETGYDQWLLGQSRGQQRYANLQQLLHIARQFDEHRGESLYLFLRHIEDLQEAVGDIEPAPAIHEDAVRLMTVHQSKGLEFPIVVAPDLGKKFNDLDLKSDALLDETYGVCTTIKPPGQGDRYASLPLWLARRRQRVDLVGEEIRLMYVAFTRAQYHVVIFGTVNQKKRDRWAENPTAYPLPQHLLKAQCWLDWIAGWLSSAAPDWLTKREGRTEYLDYRFRYPGELPARERSPAKTLEFSYEDVARLEQRLSATYPNSQGTAEPAKTSVSALRKRAAEQDEETRQFRFMARGTEDGRERGVAVHSFVEHLRLDEPLDEKGLAVQADALAAQRIIDPKQRELLDLPSLAEFWKCEFGREIIAHRKHVRRELPFTYRLGGKTVEGTGLEKVLDIPRDDFVVLQGTADLVVMLEDEIWLLDFKTDNVSRDGLAETVENYRPQIALYALALSDIFKRPVTRKALYFLKMRSLQFL